MRFVALNTIILIAACALSTGATAQKTYKCGNSYSQLPCPAAPPPPPAAPSAKEISPPQIIYIRKKKPSRHGPKDFTALVPDERKRPAKKPHSRKSGAS